MNAQSLFNSVAKMGCMKYFPADVDARLGIAEEITDICHTEEQADWLCKRMIKLFTRGWPGVGELRAVASAKFKPRDGIEAYSEAYLDGIPSEKETPLPPLQAPAMRQIAAAEAETASPSIAATLSDLTLQKDMNRVLKGFTAQIVREIPVVKITAANAITEADFARVRAEMREKQAKEAIACQKAE